MKSEAPKKTGPVPQRVEIKGNWEDAVKTALAKKRPAGGWPKPKPMKDAGPKSK